MWKKALFIVVLFYLLTLLQNSFFAHFSFFGTTPNLVFIFFFILAFFVKIGREYQIIYFAALAGVLLDISSNKYLGPSILILLLLGYLLKRMQFSLINRQDGYPFLYFIVLFAAFFLIYFFLGAIIQNFTNLKSVFTLLDLRLLARLIYNLAFAIIGFFIVKKCLVNTK